MHFSGFGQEKYLLAAKEPVVKILKLYPNPVTSEFVLDFEYDQTWIGTEINLVNMNGIPVQKIRITSKLQKVYLSNLKTGVYFIQGMNKGKKINQKIIKL